MTDPTPLRVLVTGARGGVGARAVAALTAAGHTVVATDRVPPLSDDWGDGIAYVDADLTDAGSAFAIVRGVDAVVHAAAIPTPEFHPAHVVFANNMLATYNVLEAAVRWGVARFVNISSETVPGFIFPEREALPAYVPVDEDHPIAPQDPYALAKHFGEQLMDAAVRRSDIRCVSIRPSWVQHPGDYALHLAAAHADHRGGPRTRGATSTPRIWRTRSCWRPPATCRATRCSTSPRPTTTPDSRWPSSSRPTTAVSCELRDVSRADASGISSAKAARMLGYAPTRSWRDYLDEHGRPRR